MTHCFPRGIALFSLLLALACGDDRFIVVGSATAASTSGFVEIEDDDSRGADILVHLEHLHPAPHVDPAASHYVVWLDGHKGTPLRAGTLAYDPDTRVGELRARSPFLDFVVMITAESTAEPSTPGAVVVATQAVSID